MVELAGFVEVACGVLAAALSALVCALSPAIFRLGPTRTWRWVGLIFGCAVGFCLMPLSLVTFGWLGAGLSSLIPAAGLRIPVMMIAVPITVGIGAALASWILAMILLSGAALVRLLLRRCPVLRGFRAA